MVLGVLMIGTWPKLTFEPEASVIALAITSYEPEASVIALAITSY